MQVVVGPPQEANTMNCCILQRSIDFFYTEALIPHVLNEEVGGSFAD